MKRISIQEAKTRFSNGEMIVVCPHKLNPAGPFSPGSRISGNEYILKAYQYQNSALWAGTIEKTAWKLMMNEWSYYNCGWQEGYYAHYYVE